MKKILITGGKGLIGSHLIDELVKNYEVYSMDNSQPGFGNKYINPLAHQIVGDVRKYEDVDFAIKNCDVVIHLAAVSHVSTCLQYPKMCFDINIGGTINILESCRNNNIKRVIMAASDHIYGKNPEYLPIDEDYPLMALEEKDPYGKSKAFQATLAKMYYEQYGLPVVITASGNVFSERQSKPNAIPNFIDAIKNNRHLIIHGDGLQSRDFYHVKNLVTGYIKCIETPDIEGNLFNFGSGIETNIKTIAEMILNLIPHEKSKIKYINNTKLNAMSCMVLDISKAKEILDWEPKIDLETGLKMTIENWR